MSHAAPPPPRSAPRPPHADASTGHTAAARAGVTPLWAVILFTTLNSIGSGIVYAGIFFLAETQYGFTKTDNFVLALLYGLTYIPAAFFTGRALRAFARAGVSPRTVVVGLMVGMALLAWLPPLAAAVFGSAHSSWALWLAVGLYSPLSGMLWPIVESYLAGGRSEHDLRSATGKFNIAWSGSLVLTLLGMAPLLERSALSCLVALGVVHLACAGLLAFFARTPAAHAEHEKHATPEVYARLLSFLRVLLPLAFMFIAALSPSIPFALERLGVKSVWKTPCAATWYAARVLTFFAMERWHGWHGRWSTPIAGALVLMVSMALIVLCPLLLTGPVAFVGLMLGLCGFGVGVGVIYAAALYYAMEVGSAGVDAGGMHETLIGFGYTVGPACGLIAAGCAAGGLIADPQRDPLMLALVCGLAMVVGGWALARARAHAARSIPHA